MRETQLETTESPKRGIPLFTLACVAALILFAYPLSLAPAIKLAFDHPRFGATFGPFVEVIYRPLITYMSRHPYGYVDRLFFWYATEVWKVPMFRN